MRTVLDVNPGDFAFACDMVRREYFVFVVEGDPHVSPRAMDGMGIIRKIAVPRATYGSIPFDVGGERVLVPTTDLVGLSRDVGIEQWDVMRVRCARASAILLELPGPMAREILAPGGDADVVRHLSRWYRAVTERDGSLTFRLF